MNSKTIITTTALAATFALGMLTNAASADQPKMHDALGHLRQARADLQAADNDKGGHRQRAIASVNAAINQVEAGIRFDRRH